jgi:hypothetical protein
MTQPQNSAEDPDLEQIVATSEDAYGEVSIDDALETDRVVAEGPESRNDDGYGFDGDLARGGDDATAAEQGNRDEDRMTAEEEDPALDEILRSSDDGGTPPQV